MSAFPSSSHDHSHCISQALLDAREICRRKGVRLTELRARVLELVWQSHRPLGAYQILELIRADGRSAQPPTVYRALEFLQAHGLVHRLATLNAYLGCVAPDSNHQGQFLICQGCGSVAEVDETRLAQAVEEVAINQGFVVQQAGVEIAGLCPACQTEDEHHNVR